MMFMNDPNTTPEQAYEMLRSEYDDYMNNNPELDRELHTLECDIQALWEMHPDLDTFDYDTEPCPYNNCWWLAGRYLGHL